MHYIHKHAKMGTITHNNDVIMSSMVSKITSVSAVYSIVCSGADQIKHQSFTSLAFMGGIHWWPVNSAHKGPVTRKMFLFDDVIMRLSTENGIFYLYGLTLIPTWNHMPSKECDEITYPFSNFNGAAVNVSEWMSNFIPHLIFLFQIYLYMV